MSRGYVCTQGAHEKLKTGLELFLSRTVRLPHHMHAEAVQDGLLYRNCPLCLSTLTFELVADDMRERMLVDRIVRWAQGLDQAAAPAGALDRVTDFDLPSPEAEALVYLEDFRRDGTTVLDRVCSLVSDEMMAADRAQREAAFALALDESALEAGRGDSDAAPVAL